MLQTTLQEVAEVVEASPVGLVLVKATVALMAVWLLHASVRHANPRWRVFLWRATGVSVLLLPLAQMMPTLFEIEWSASPNVVSKPAFEETKVTSPDIAAEPALPPVGREFATSSSASQKAVAYTSLTTSGDQASPVDWGSVLFCVWAFGAVVGMGRLVFATRRIYQLVRDSRPVPNWISKQADIHALAMGLRSVDVLRSSNVTSPVVLGFTKKTILLPDNVCCDEYRRGMPYILLHELSHVRHRDLAWNMVMHIVAAILWFHPFVWWMRVAHLAACELVADIESARAGGDTEAYRQTLARIALNTAGVAIPGLAMARSSDVRRRLSVLPRTSQFRKLGRNAVSLAALATITVFLVIGGLRVVLAENTNVWTLSFPGEADYGTVESYDQPDMTFGYPSLSTANRVQSAQGDVKVRRDQFTTLKLNGRVSQDLSLLLDLPVEAVNGLTISNCTLDAAAFETIGRFSDLRLLRLEKCSLAEGVDIDSVKVAKELQYFQFDAADEDDIEGFIRWTARCPKVAYAWCRNRFFNAKDLTNFAGHRAASFLPVSVGSNGRELFGALKKIPNLRALNLRVEKDADAENWSELAGLKSVELFNWSGGSIDAALLESMGKMKKLRVLRLQGGAVLAKDFPDGLKQLVTLEHLVLNAKDSLCTDDEIHLALQTLTHLANWPRLTKPSKQALRALATRSARTSIHIKGLGKDATVADVVAVLNTDKLTHVNLSDIPLTKEIAAAIEKNRKLEHISLSAAEFDGSVFSELDQLSIVNDLSLWVSSRATNLDVLSQLPALESLQLGVKSMLPRDLSFLPNCPKITSLSVVYGYSDDTTAKLIGESSTLRRATLGQDCFMTDAAVELLLKNQRLERIFISGHISTEAALRLKQLPRLVGLTLWSDSIPEEERDSLKSQFEHLTSVDIREFSPSSGKYEVGIDGIWRMKLREGDLAFNKLEGKHARELFGAESYDRVKSIMKDRVVLVDFWGTWCGPCLMLKPRLQELASKYGEDGFEVISIHSQRGLEDFGNYTNLHPMLWANLLDTDGELARSFGVRLYPSLYVFDRKGVLRVARPHRLKLDDAVTNLLQD